MNPQIVEEEIAKFDEKFDPEEYWQGDNYITLELKDFLRSSLLTSYQQGVKDENLAWLERERCESCGNPMKAEPLTDTCANCYENN